MINRDFEHILIAVWLQGRYIDHLDRFEEADFMIYPHVFTALKKVRPLDLLEVSRLSGERVSDLMQIVSDYGWSYELFQGAFKAMSEHSMKRIAAEYAANPYDVAEFTRKLATASNGFTETDENLDLSKSYKDFLDQRNEKKRLYYGLPAVDAVTGGMQAGQMIVGAARPAIGKTAWALQIALHVAREGHKVIFFSLEMTANQITERIVCRYSDVPAAKLKTPRNLSPDEWDSVDNALCQIPKALRIIQDIRTIGGIRQLVESEKPELVIIDQLSHIKTGDFKTIRDRYVHLTRAVKGVAVELDVPIILLAQVNRAGHDRLPTLADLAESSSIEADADNIFVIHRPSKEEIKDKASLSSFFDYDALDRNGRVPIVLSLAKHRNGETGRFPMLYHGKKFMFEEVIV